MPAKNAKEVVDHLKDDATAAEFARAFLASYLNPALVFLSKTEIDLLVFTRLIAAEAIDPDGPIFTISRTLNITPQPARGR